MIILMRWILCLAISTYIFLTGEYNYMQQKRTFIGDKDEEIREKHDKYEDQKKHKKISA